MSDIIRLLPDSVANQIAAGEVVQRPASAVKELLENAIDAGATDIKLMIKDAGKMLIQVVDNGCGMSERDARMCFERHATSKIRRADDLLEIRTMGFRGEALASIASIAHVELKTRLHDEELGTSVVVEGTEFVSQTPVSCPPGTSISVRNLFFNVPARRNFLKSNTLELKHVVEAFFRVALVNPDILFTFYNQDRLLHQLPASNLKQRITALFGPSYAQRLIPVEHTSHLINITGYLAKPEFARKSRGEQYFFTNGRYMKSPYLHHCVEAAFRELIPDDAVPSYFLYMEVEPGKIDVNIHPTKTEINFQDIQGIYANLHAAVRQSLGRFTLSPTIDFETEPSMLPPVFPRDKPVNQPGVTVDPLYNPFEKRVQPQSAMDFPLSRQPSPKGWDELYAIQPGEGRDVPVPDNNPGEDFRLHVPETTQEPEKRKTFQVRNAYLVTHTRSGIVIIDQQHAHERVLYEKFLSGNAGGDGTGQFLLIPRTIRLNHNDSLLLTEWWDHFRNIGFDLSDLGNGSFAVNAVPADVTADDPGTFIESVLELLKSPGADARSGKQQLLARSLARRLAIRRGKPMHQAESDSLAENLFACQAPSVSPDGKPTMVVITYEELNAKFKI